MLLGDAYDGQRVDMWSCGCSLYIMLVGNYPFRSMADNNISHVKRMQAMFPRIMAGNYTAIPNVRHPARSGGICENATQRTLATPGRPSVAVPSVCTRPWLLKC